MTHCLLQDARDRLVLTALKHAPFTGWGVAALRQAAHDCTIDPEVASRLFPDGGLAMLIHFDRLADRFMTQDATERHDLESLRVQERVSVIIQSRLQRWEAHKEAIRRALATYAVPPRAPVGVRSMMITVDAIWKAAGDRSNDFNWYTKRASLATVYAATVMFWLGDSSQHSEATSTFLERRLSGLVEIIKARKKKSAVLKEWLKRADVSKGLHGLRRQKCG